MFLHIRAIDDEGNLLAKGGATLCWSWVDEEFVAVQVAWCSFSDRFEKKVGRDVALERLHNVGPFDIVYILDKKMPVESIIEWAEKGLMDYPIVIYRDQKNRCVSSFDEEEL